MADARINVYHNLSVMLDAGLPITRALQNAKRYGRFGRVIGSLKEAVTSGQSLSDAVDVHRRRLAKLDIALIKVGEHTGQLAEMFGHLSDWYNFCQRIRRAMFTGSLLPLIYIHVGAFLIPVPKWAFGGWDPKIYWSGFFLFLSIFYVPGIILTAIIKLTPREGILRRILDTITLHIPYLGKSIREVELARYSKVFSITYKAGVPIVQCSEIALDSVMNLVIRDRLKGAHEQVKIGDEMSRGFGAGLPMEFKELWQIGEESGDLDETCRRLGEMHADNAENRFKVMSKIVPFMFYMVVMLILVYYVFKFWLGIYGGLVTV